eukprot:scaffold61512_cov49-Phaeocystis_antarctica.AAC.2
MRHQRWLVREWCEEAWRCGLGPPREQQRPVCPRAVLRHAVSLLVHGRSRQPTCYSLWQPLVKCCSIKLHLSGSPQRHAPRRRSRAPLVGRPPPTGRAPRPPPPARPSTAPPPRGAAS